MPGWRGFLASKPRYRNHTYNGPINGTERGDLIVAPNYLIYGALGLLCALPLSWFVLARHGKAVKSQHGALNLFELARWIKKLVRLPFFQFNLLVPMLAVFYFVILAGLIGTKVSGRNAGPMAIRVLWLSVLIILLVPLGGRMWRLVCPLPVLGEWLQRRRKATAPAESKGGAAQHLSGWALRWPEWMNNAWPRLIFFLLLGTFSTALRPGMRIGKPGQNRGRRAGVAGGARAEAGLPGSPRSTAKAGAPKTLSSDGTTDRNACKGVRLQI